MKVTHRQIDELIIGTYGTHIPTTKRDGYEIRNAGDVLHQYSRAAYETHLRSAREVKGQYHYIPYSTTAFVQYMQSVRKIFPNHTHFIDVGCGIGDKLLLAKQFCRFKQVSGVEYDPVTCAIAQETVGGIASVLINADANEIDFAPFSCIYMYCPIFKEDLMRELFIHIARSMPEEAIITDMLPVYMHDQRAKEFHELFAQPVNRAQPFLFQKRDGLLHQITGMLKEW